MKNSLALFGLQHLPYAGEFYPGYALVDFKKLQI